jgi:DNA-binding Lrp family transcriptional regulator
VSTPSARESFILDDTDRVLIRALQLAPRGAFSGIGEVLGLSEQTVARRFRRLSREGVIRVVGVVNPQALGESSWVVRVQCRPDGTSAIAAALAKREDVAWLYVAAAGAEVVCSLRSRSSEQREDLLLQRLPRTATVLGINAAVVLHTFVGGRADDWAELSPLISASQAERLAAMAISPVPPGEIRGQVMLEPADEPLLGVLTRSGRASYAELAAAAGISEGRAARRVAALLQAGVIYLDVDLSAAMLGYRTQASLWLTVTPAHLDAAGRALSAYPEVAFAAAISGPRNLTASVSCRDLDHLYQFATAGVGSLPGVQMMEISPVLRPVKQSGSVLAGGRLADPAVAAAGRRAR